MPDHKSESLTTMSSLWTNLGFLIMSENKLLYFKVTFRRKFCYSAHKLPDIIAKPVFWFLLASSCTLHSVSIVCYLSKRALWNSYAQQSYFLQVCHEYHFCLDWHRVPIWNLNYTGEDIKKVHHFLMLFLFFSAVLGPSVCWLSLVAHGLLLLGRMGSKARGLGSWGAWWLLY